MTIYEAIATIMNEGYSIGKEKENKQQNFKYRGIDDVMNVFHPLLAEHSVFVVPEVLEQTREERVSKNNSTLVYSILKMRYTFYSADGTSVSAVVVGEGMDSGDKASNKAMAVAMKYAMFQVFCIPTEEMDDPDSEAYEVKPKAAPKKPEAKQEPKAAPKAAPKQEQKEKPALPAPAADGYWYCENCGEVVNMIVGNNGDKIFPKDIVAMSMKRTGKCLCSGCLKKAEAVKNGTA